MEIVFVIGDRNAGKSTQAAILQADASAKSAACFPMRWLCELSAARETSDVGSYVFHNWSRDTLGPLVLDYIERNLSGAIECSRQRFVIDGFPRTRSDVHALAAVCRGREFTVVDLVVAADVLEKRGSGAETCDGDDTSIAAVRAALDKQRIERVCVRGDLSVNEVAAQIRQALLAQATKMRLALPPVSPPRRLAQRQFTEVGAIDSAAIIQRCLRLACSTRLFRQFVGTHPVSLTRDNIDRIRQHPYLVSLKATGVRFMCLVHASRLWMVSRSLTVYASNRPLAELVHAQPPLCYEDTLLDGELIGGTEHATHYLVLDCLAASGRNCMNAPILERMRLSVSLGRLLHASSLLRFSAQEYVDRGQIDALLDRANSLPWPVDGVILQPARLPYRLGIDYNLFKYKPLAENSADFYYSAHDRGLYARVTAVADAQKPPQTQEKTLLQKGRLELVRFGRLLPSLCPEWLRDGCIVEAIALVGEDRARLDADELARANFTADDIVWVPRMLRGDKLFPNVDWVVRSVVQSIRDNITIEELVEQCRAPSIRRPQSSSHPPPTKRRR